jgi:Rne/Rng family ribonuclease
MQKELIISTTSQETKLAILEDDELVEFYIERYRSQGIVGNIYKGKVTKVLPGMQSAFVDIGLERDAFLYVSDFFEDIEEYDKIVSTVEDEVAQLQEGGRGKAAQPALPVPLVSVAAPPQPVPAIAPAESESVVETEAEPAAATLSMPTIQPLPGETIGEGERTISSGPPAHEDYERRGRDGGRGRRDRDRDRDRDRRGKKPKIPSFESKSFESKSFESKSFESKSFESKSFEAPRPDERSFSSKLEALPGESLSKLSNRSGPRQAPEDEEKNAPLAAEEPPSAAVVEPESSSSARQEAAPHETSKHHEEERPAAEEGSARITDRSDNYSFAHRSSGRRSRRGRSGPPPEKTEELRTNGASPKAGPTISELLREGQEILVQISKEPLGKKGARITSHIALPGRYLVYMPTVDHVGVSRKIASDEERSRLKRIINEHRNGLPGGFIVRTAAEGRGEDEFVQDIRFLGNLWGDIRAKSDKKSAPALIHSDLNLVQRLLRDQLSYDYRAIRLDNEAEFATVLDFVSKFQPALVNRVKLHTKDTPIFEEYGLNTEIEKALRPKVWLKSGGYIVINQTEALVAIDVNTGKFVGKSNRLEDTIVRTNVDAVHEIVRQIRLRNLGGIIVVDFIDMEEKKNRQRVMAALEEAVRADRVPSKILQFNDFGLVAITRKRTQPSLERTICRPCSYCNGAGWSKTPETICYEIQQEIKKMAHMFDSKEITIRVNPEIGKALKSGEFISLNDIEDWTKKDIIVKSDPLLHEEHFDIF